MIGSKEQPKDIFGGRLMRDDTVVYIKHGRMHQGIVTGFTDFGVRLVDENGEKVGNILRDRVAGPESVAGTRHTRAVSD